MKEKIIKLIEEVLKVPAGSKMWSSGIRWHMS